MKSKNDSIMEMFMDASNLNWEVLAIIAGVFIVAAVASLFITSDEDDLYDR
jgi:hypothetical protein